MAGGDTNIALARRDDPRTVRTQQANVGEVPSQLVVKQSLVVGRDSFSDGHNELNASLGGFKNRGPDPGGGYKNARGGSSGGLNGFGDGGVDGNAIGAGLPRVGAGHNLGSVFPVQDPVITSLGARKALVNNAGICVDEDAHRLSRLRRPGQRPAGHHRAWWEPT